LVWLLYAARLVLLTGERWAFNRLGADAPLWAAAWVAYAGGALVCILASLATGHVPFVASAVTGALVYSVSFLAYFGALQVGPLSVVGAWPAATALMLWLFRPDGGWAGLGGVNLVVLGALLLAGADWSARARRGIALMLLSDATLAVAREWDRVHVVALLPYAATIFSGVALVMGVGVLVTRQVSAVSDLVRRRPALSLAAGLSNGSAYWTLVALLQFWPPYLIEALSGAAGLLTVAVALATGREAAAPRKLVGAGLLALGGALLAWLRGQGVR
jgi:hypothetical protein